MKISDFDYRLPPELVAQAPAARREESRLLLLPRAGGPISHRRFRDLPGELRAGDVLVLNDTRVVPARLSLRRASGGRVEGLLVRRTAPGTWEALLKSKGRVAVGDRLGLEGPLGAVVREKTAGGSWILEFDAEAAAALDRLGRAPLPPYIRRPDGPDETDRARYQTVYADKPGAIAAPTAGLHFTRELLAELADAGVRIVRLTLHVGTGTFKPVEVEDLEQHRLDPEWYEIPAATAAEVRAAKAEGRRVVAVGTTSTRTLEAWARTGESSGWTDLFIRPPFEFRIVDALVTNFHVPRSTLLVLVCTFAGRERVLGAYAEAVRERYRFFSYGDSCLIS